MDRIKLETRHVSIEFPGVKVLDGINFEVTTGEIRTVVGANRAGKSTLMKVLTGTNSAYIEEVLLNGERVEVRTPVDAKKLGIQTVYQEMDMALYPTSSVTENIVQNGIVMGESGYIVNWKKAYKQRREALDRLHIGRDQVDEHELIQNLSLARKQTVLITKTIRSKCNFLILDEPIAPLSNTKTEELSRIVKHLHETENTAILFISYRLNEILEVYGNYTVMRNGKMTDTTPVTRETTTRETMKRVLRRRFKKSFPRGAYQIGDVLFQTGHLSDIGGKIKSVSIQVKKGEVVEIAGLVGTGKPELYKIIFGAYKKTGGRVLLKNRELRAANPSGAVRGRMALVPEKRGKEGVLVSENVGFDLSAACLSWSCTGPFIRRRKVDDNAKQFMKDLGISTPSVRQQIENLSGGSQQKVAMGKWLAADCDVYMFDEPTKGVDVGTKQDIFHLINKIAKQGNYVIHASCKDSELLSLTDRIYVMYNSTVMAELETANTTEDEIMYYSVGGKDNKNEK